MIHFSGFQTSCRSQEVDGGPAPIQHEAEVDCSMSGEEGS